MKKITLFISLAAASTFFAACGAPAANTGANNANINTTKPVAVAPTAGALMAYENRPTRLMLMAIQSCLWEC